MSESLKDQLRALGLARNKPQKVSKKAGVNVVGGKSRGGDISLDQAYRMRNRQERQQKEQAIARKREQERKQREINQKIKALVAANVLRDEAADIKRNFLYKGRIRSVLVTVDQLREVNDGTLGVVYLSGNYHLLPSGKVAEIHQFAPGHIPDLRGAESEDEKDYPVPDDLTW